MLDRLVIRPYNWRLDERAIHALWMEVLGAKWPLSRETFHQATVCNGPAASYRHFVALLDHERVGFALAQTSSDYEGNLCGGIMALAVVPGRQRQGIGRMLMKSMTEHLRALGVVRLYLGCGGDSYFWPGVPENLPGAVSFCERCGWQFTEVMYDMVGDLHRFVFDPAWLERIHAHGYQVKAPTPVDTARLIDFEREHFPDWVASFTTEITAGRLHNLLMAVDGQGEIAGSVSLFTNQDGVYDNGLAWKALLGDDMGGFGVLGVRADLRNQGIGLALAAEATRRLQERGVHLSFVGWTYLETLYGQLGYKIWRRYHMSAPWT